MTTITPTRFGLKYAPIPTISLEYEEDIGTIDDESGMRSLYVFLETKSGQENRPRMRKKVHVVELPSLTGHSEPQEIARQLQQANQRFLGPSVVKEQQLRRLLQQLVDHLQRGECSINAATSSRPVVGTDGMSAMGKEEESEDETEDDRLDESALDVHSNSPRASRAVTDTIEAPASSSSAPPTRASSIPQEQSDTKDNDQLASSHQAEEVTNGPPVAANETATESDADRDEAAEDEKKKQALHSQDDSERSDDDDDEEVQSDELEYFSEDGSDEDSF